MGTMRLSQRPMHEALTPDMTYCMQLGDLLPPCFSPNSLAATRDCLGRYGTRAFTRPAASLIVA